MAFVFRAEKSTVPEFVLKTTLPQVIVSEEGFGVGIVPHAAAG